MFSSYRKQSVDLQSKSIDWFLYDGNIGRWKVREKKRKEKNLTWPKHFISLSVATSYIVATSRRRNCPTLRGDEVFERSKKGSLNF